ncbi:MAG: NAD-dependent epimerase/dehydratase family protein, partial [Saprospiraceae bacterium]|nr:NAD-dependent epimerase/dehydratase family protein [Saprospiraceae bacterium]
MKRILITGASGFIGGFLVEEALKRNWEVTAAVRPTSNRRWLQDERIRFLELDFRD